MSTLSTTHEQSDIDITLPEQYFHRFDFESNHASFIQMNRQSFKTSPFLDNRIDRISDLVTKIDQEEYLTLEDSALRKKKCKFIFHTAYCCSTLLSRALDIDNKTLAYREPISLHQLAVMKRRPEMFSADQFDSWDKYLRFTLQMLSKTWGKKEIAIIKATDSCNNIIVDIAAVIPDSSLLLYSKLEDFIASNLKSDGRRRFLKNFVMRSSKDAYSFPVVSSINANILNDAKSAVYVWMVQMLSYEATVKRSHCKTLDAANLLDRPQHYLSSLSQYFELDLNHADIEGIIQGPAWNRHAKISEKASFSSEDRLKEKTNVISQNKSDIRAAIQWAYKLYDWDVCIKNIESFSLR